MSQSTKAPVTKTLTDLLSHLVQFPSVSTDHATNEALLDWVQRNLSHLPLTFHHHEQAGVASLTATTPAVTDPKRPKLWLMAHTDVVPGEPGDFTPRLENGRFYGRGAYDMKYGIAVFIALLQQLGQSLADYDLGLMLVTDEEPGGHHGASYLSATGYSSQAMILPECGIPWNMEQGAKSLVWWQLTASGRAAHGAYPWLGVNPIDNLMRYISLISEHFTPEPCHVPDHRHHTMNVGAISGGNVPNRVPATATAKLDLRILPQTSLDEVRAWFAEASLAVPTVTATEIETAPGFYNKAGDASDLFERLTNEITGHDVTHKIAHASSDARYFGAAGVEVICAPPDGGGQHSSGEWIDIADLGRYYEIIEQFVEQYAGPNA